MKSLVFSHTQPAKSKGEDITIDSSTWRTLALLSGELIAISDSPTKGLSVGSTIINVLNIIKA